LFVVVCRWFAGSVSVIGLLTLVVAIAVVVHGCRHWSGCWLFRRRLSSLVVIIFVVCLSFRFAGLLAGLLLLSVACCFVCCVHRCVVIGLPVCCSFGSPRPSVRLSVTGYCCSFVCLLLFSPLLGLSQVIITGSR
jgi:hypothetical protein